MGLMSFLGLEPLERTPPRAAETPKRAASRRRRIVIESWCGDRRGASESFWDFLRVLRGGRIVLKAVSPSGVQASMNLFTQWWVLVELGWRAHLSCWRRTADERALCHPRMHHGVLSPDDAAAIVEATEAAASAIGGFTSSRRGGGAENASRPRGSPRHEAPSAFPRRINLSRTQATWITRRRICPSRASSRAPASSRTRPPWP